MQISKPERHPLIYWMFMSVILMGTGCTGYDSSIPDTYVYVERDLYATKLNEPNATCYITSTNLAREGLGYGGIIIVHGFDGSYYAFDLSCPVEHRRDVRIGRPNQNLVSKCDSCGEEYELGWGLGVPVNHISKETLRRYRVSIKNNNITVTR